MSKISEIVSLAIQIGYKSGRHAMANDLAPSLCFDLRSVKYDAVRRALEITGDNRTHAARLCNCSIKTIYNILNTLGNEAH